MPDRTPNHPAGAELLDRIVRLNRWVTRHTAWTLPLAQARVLSLVDELETARIGDLARAERCTQPTMTAQVHRLQAQGLVSRAPDPEDARAARISLTEQGRRTLADIRRARAGIVESLVEQLDAADRARLHEAVRALSALLDAAYRQEPGR
ncbi:MarR family winged helix-turn-helix transcriptional regulator [Castellaniella defragrans]|jgi:DNA-binding MarR family transcriptional regulator|uniref:Transcriptional regulator, MarR family n=2 Tax=Castellaniella defragrans TaxID=75697 RepID=W8X4F3_CASD6|nr:MarR family transcriptional regulator [Castellaniella defragrans]KAB0610265.1 MarR family transcriptional regulator [Castellaniella defragrans]MBB6082360.1 DNA-binding MarR family transcriptional regulator [Castellaniella defragrans]CDM24782.1 Transcriptional regulator, MarR family [Castellaniella defragrans 65Phen]